MAARETYRMYVHLHATVFIMKFMSATVFLLRITGKNLRSYVIQQSYKYNAACLATLLLKSQRYTIKNRPRQPMNDWSRNDVSTSQLLSQRLLVRREVLIAPSPIYAHKLRITNGFTLGRGLRHYLAGQTAGLKLSV